MSNRDLGTHDLWLEYTPSGGSADKRGLILAKDEAGVKQYREGYATAITPTNPTSAFSYEHVPPQIDVPVAFENWHAGSGYVDANVRVDEVQDGDASALASHRYSYSQGVDPSWVDRCYLSPELQTGGATTSGNPIKFVYSSLGLFLLTTRYVMEWTGSAWTERYDNGTSSTLTDLFEYSNSADTYLVLGRTDLAYLVSTDGINFSSSDAPGSAPSLRSDSGTTATATSITLTAPTGLADNDILLACIQYDVNGFVTAPAGFTLLTSIQQGGANTTFVYWKRASSESGNYTFTVGSSSDLIGWIGAFQNCVTSGSPFDAVSTSTTSADTAFTPAAITTLDDNRLLVSMAYAHSATPTWTAASGFTEQHDAQGVGMSLHVGTKSQASAGSSGTVTMTASVSATGGEFLTALAPAAPTGSFDTAFFTVRSSANGDPTLWSINSAGDLRNTEDPVTPSAWSAADATQLGQDGQTITGMVTVNNKILIVTDQGLTSYDGSTVSTVWSPRTLSIASDVAAPFVWVDNNLYFPGEASLLCYNEEANALVRVWPTNAMRGHPELNGTITAIGGNDRRMFFILKNSAGNYYLMAGDPATGEFHTMAYRGSAVCDAILAVPGASDTFSTTNPHLVLGDDASGDYFILPRAGLRPEDDSNYRFDTAQGTLYGPFVDFGMQAITKFLNRGDIEGDDLDSDDTITLQYQTPGGTATTVATANSDGRTSTAEADEVEFSTIRYVALLDNGANTTSPVLKGVALHATPNPPRKRVWDFAIEVSYGLQQVGGGVSRHAGDALKTFIFDSVNERCTLYDREGSSYTVRILEVEGQGIKATPNGDIRLYRLIAVEI